MLTSISLSVGCPEMVTPVEVPSSRTTGVPPERKPCPRMRYAAVCQSCTAWGMQELIALVGSQVVMCVLPSAGWELGTTATFGPVVGPVTCRDCTYTFLNTLPGSRLR